MEARSSSLLCAFLLVAAVGRVAQADKLAIIMLDGFRHDYTDRLGDDEIPNFKDFLATGTRAEYVQPIFPSESYPSWTTIVTGLRAENHGIVGNYMYNRENGLEFALAKSSFVDGDTSDPSWWDEHVPLWTSATEEGLRTSLYLWSRCDVPFNDILPEKCIPFNSIDNLMIEDFRNNLLEAADDLLNGFDLTMVYYGNVDEQGHIFGPESFNMDQIVITVDGVLGEFMEVLEVNGLRETTNVIIVSDHGMTDLTGKTSSKITNFIDGDLIERACGVGAYMNLGINDPSMVDEVAEDLSAWEGIDAYLKEDLPDKLGLKNNDLVMDIVLISQGDDGSNSDLQYFNAFIPPPLPSEDVEVITGGGAHGYDDTSSEKDQYNEGEYPDMRAIFFANGPAFKQGFVSDWIKIIDEYQVFLELLGIQGEAHEGTFERVQDMFA